MNYLVLKADGEAEILTRDMPMQLKELRVLVGGGIEALKPTARSAITMMVNEAALLRDLPDNLHCPGLCGNVVLGKTEAGEFLGLSAYEFAALLRNGWRHQ